MARTDLGCTLVYNVDDAGASFVLFDHTTRTIYKDITTEKDLMTLFATFKIKKTVTNDATFDPPTGSVVHQVYFGGEDGTLHTAQRAVRFAEFYFTGRVRRTVFRFGAMHMRTLELPTEEWRTWLI